MNKSPFERAESGSHAPLNRAIQTSLSFVHLLLARVQSGSYPEAVGRDAQGLGK